MSLPKPIGRTYDPVHGVFRDTTGAVVRHAPYRGNRDRILAQQLFVHERINVFEMPTVWPDIIRGAHGCAEMRSRASQWMWRVNQNLAETTCRASLNDKPNNGDGVAQEVDDDDVLAIVIVSSKDGAGENVTFTTDAAKSRLTTVIAAIRALDWSLVAKETLAVLAVVPDLAAAHVYLGSACFLNGIAVDEMQKFQTAQFLANRRANLDYAINQLCGLWKSRPCARYEKDITEAIKAANVELDEMGPLFEAAQAWLHEGLMR